MPPSDGCFVAQVSNLLYRQLPVGRPSAKTEVVWNGRALRVGNPRYSRLEVCATAACTRLGTGSAEIAQKALYGHFVNDLLFIHKTFTINNLSGQTGGMAWPLHGVNWLSFYHNY